MEDRRKTRERAYKCYLSDVEFELMEWMREALEDETGAKVSRSEFMRRALLSLTSSRFTQASSLSG